MSRDYPPAFPLKHQQKDMRLALALGYVCVGCAVWSGWAGGCRERIYSQHARTPGSWHTTTTMQQLDCICWALSS